MGVAPAHALPPPVTAALEAPFTLAIAGLAFEDVRAGPLRLYRPLARGPPLFA
jgi:hypothetical protein